MTQPRILVISLLLLAAVAVLYLGGLKSAGLEPIYTSIAQLNGVVKNLTQIEEIRNAWMRDYYTKQALERVKQLQRIGYSSGYEILYNVIVPEMEQQEETKKNYEKINGKLGVIHISTHKGHRIVNGAGMAACEYCFIHTSCMKQYGAVELKRYLNDVKI
ncbi:hypothetical protein ANCCEY_03329 [Ancylostoma ceylanicum]|uniref:Uncharacterized protein n=1 Tax=Ancylostoma ceylanicum TaxID=53326 RepID=A0A0D6M583_9BILA|nr:hypothetical protein ANCCEY_03329 [Ancylostoma ceylanicum]